MRDRENPLFVLFGTPRNHLSLHEINAVNPLLSCNKLICQNRHHKVTPEIEEHPDVLSGTYWIRPLKIDVIPFVIHFMVKFYPRGQDIAKPPVKILRFMDEQLSDYR